tara:strand:+ start:2281 stop:2535 length:255 start_codon:yes stop_codon:yes gene_type:complete
MSIEKLKKVLREKELAVGEKSVLRLVKAGKAKEVFLANNCKPSIRETIEQYAKISTLSIVNLDINATEVGILAKKQFSISILCY